MSSASGPHRATTDLRQDGTLGTLLLAGMVGVAFVIGFDPFGVIYIEGLSEIAWGGTFCLAPVLAAAAVALVYGKLFKEPRGVTFLTPPRLGETVRVHALVPASPMATVEKVQAVLVARRGSSEILRVDQTSPNLGEPSQYLDFDLEIPAMDDPFDLRWSLTITPLGRMPMVDVVLPIEAARIVVKDLFFDQGV